MAVAALAQIHVLLTALALAVPVAEAVSLRVSFLKIQLWSIRNGALNYRMYWLNLH